VAREVRPRSSDELRAALRQWSGTVSVGGGRFSMGGQVAAPDSLHIDMRSMAGVVSLDPARRSARVRAGTTWRDLQDAIDPHGLSVKIMQSYSNFTVGGSVGVNCHGRYVGRGPLVNSVRSMQVVTADGEVLEVSRERESDLFGAIFGGYGGLAIVSEVELDLDQNVRIERSVDTVPLADYAAYFRDRIVGRPEVVLHNADLTPPNFDLPRNSTWTATTKPVTEPRRLVPRGLDYSREQNAIWAITELPGGAQLRDKIESSMLRYPSVVWRNFEASMDTACLEPRTRKISTYVLQEYFIPVANFVPFARAMAAILRKHDANVLNVSIRHSPADGTALLAWAPAEVFCFVLYYKQRTNERASSTVETWTRELVNAALANGGRYYLPYRLHATQQQFERAYPEAAKFAALKRRVDPRGRLTNLLWNKYLPRTA
jgi:FAD/FMN-containing dehydrogenase